jgi:hypothetical protein
METDYQVIKTQPRIKPTTNGQTSLPLFQAPELSQIKPRKDEEIILDENTHTDMRGQTAVHGRAVDTMLIDGRAD